MVKKTKKKNWWPKLDNVNENWANTQRAEGRRVPTLQISLTAKSLV